MRVALEEFVPYDRSLLWRLHEAYFACRGAAAWTAGEVPYYGANNEVIARQHALLLLEVVREQQRAGELKPDGPVWILEIGAGLGHFAVNLIHVLHTACGRPGRQLAQRIRYVVSDYSARALTEAFRQPQMAELAKSGRVRPAVFDFHAPDELVDLEGRAIRARFSLLVANYVCCVAPLKILRRTSHGYYEKFVRLQAESPPRQRPKTRERLLRELMGDPTQAGTVRGLKRQPEWRPVELDSIFTNPKHAATIRRLLADFPEAGLPYPHVFLDCLEALAGRMKPGGMALVNDYGTPEAEELRDLRDLEPQVYGNSLAHEVHFAVFDAWCRELGWGLVRTREPLRNIHSVAIRFDGPLPRRFVTAFHGIYEDAGAGEDMIDFTAAAEALVQAKEYRLAARLYQRCLKQAPEDAELLYRVGECCIDAGCFRMALDYLRRGRELGEDSEWDFDYQLGRAHAELEDWLPASKAFEATVAREPRADKLARLAEAYLELGYAAGAEEAASRALELDPAEGRAQGILGRLA